MRALRGMVKKMKDAVGIKKHSWFDCRWEITHKRGGEVIWSQERRNSLFDEGERAVLMSFFRDTEHPVQFYVRLANDSLVEDDTLIDVRNEPAGNGYAPVLVERSAIGFPTIELNDGDYRLVSKTIAFTASGGNIGPVNVAYLATTTDNSGKLLAAMALSMPRTVLDGDTLEANLRIKLS